MNKSKRLKYSVYVLILTYIIFICGLYFNYDPITLATGLTMLNTPLYTYIIGETIRKSDKK